MAKLAKRKGRCKERFRVKATSAPMPFRLRLKGRHAAYAYVIWLKEKQRDFEADFPSSYGGRGKMQLYHISDDPKIEIFDPKPANTKAWPTLTNCYVWAVSDEMVHNYYFPRFCPRVCRMIGPETTSAEKDLFFAYGKQKAIIFIEKKHKNEIESTTLTKYEFNLFNFHPIDYDAGYYISEHKEKPINIETISHLPNLLAQCNVKLIYVDDLEKYRKENAESKYRYSNIRMAFIGS